MEQKKGLHCTFSIILTFRRPQTTESCLVVISFLLPGDWLAGPVIFAGGGSVAVGEPYLQ